MVGICEIKKSTDKLKFLLFSTTLSDSSSNLLKKIKLKPKRKGIMKKLSIASLLLILPVMSYASGVGSLYSQISRTCVFDISANGNPETQLPWKSSAEANKLDPKIAKTFEEAHKANPRLLDVSSVCIDEVMAKYKELYGETIPVT